jgi:hypothetical protein
MHIREVYTMNSIAEILVNSKQLLDGISNFVDKYIGCNLLRKCGIRKMVDSISESGDYEYIGNPVLNLIGDKKSSKVVEKCVSAKKLLTDKIVVCFHTAVSPYLMFKTGTFFSDYKKDTFYRFDLNKKANWERLQLETAGNVIHDIESRTDKNHVNCLIFDDSLYRRTRGKGTDLCAKVYDHNDNKMRLGFRMMTGGWSNGEIYIPFQQSLLTTRNGHLMVGKDEHVDGRTLRGRRRARAKEKGTVVVQSMVQQAQKAEIPFDYVLFDTWFSNPAQLVALNSINADVIAMIKKNKTKYTLVNEEDGSEEKLNINEIYSRFKKRPGRSKYLLCVDVKVADQNGKSIPAKLIYARNRNNKKQWICFICTDMECSPEDVLRIYTMRWACEVYFSIAKNYLKLRTECHSTSYDAITAHMVIVAIRYMILALERFNSTDTRGIEELMYQVQREVVNEMMDCAIILIIDTLLDSIRECFGVSESRIGELVNLFISKLPDVWRRRFKVTQTGEN